MNNDISCLINLDISRLDLGNELKRVGIKCGSDLFIPVALDCVKAAIQQQICDCNLSPSMCDKLILELQKYGMSIRIDDNISPNPTVLPYDFSKGNRKLAEQQRAYNYASWTIIQFCEDGKAENFLELEPLPDYPNNLIKAVYDFSGRPRMHPTTISEEEIYNLLWSLKPYEIVVLQLLFQQGFTIEKFINAMDLVDTPVIRWGIEEKIGQVRGYTINKMYLEWKQYSN